MRNPRYDPASDRPSARESNPDRFVFPSSSGRPAAAEVFKRLAAGELEDAILSSSPKVLGSYAEAARKRGRLRVNSADWLFYLSMNLTRPPFDDVHVRRAMSWVMDKAALREAWGGPLAGSIAHHYVPDEPARRAPRSGRPFATPGDHGSLARAKAEMAKSKYATRNGVCVAAACKRVFPTANCNADLICGDLMPARPAR